MSRYIDLKVFDDWHDDGYDLYASHEALYSAPSIDIVRCKECKYWDTKWIPSGEDDDVHWCSWKDLVEYGDWFCADGERKESE